jgi:hypothetical protein
VLVNVLIPQRLNEEQRHALETFERTADERTYGRDDGVFGRIRAAFR